MKKATKTVFCCTAFGVVLLFSAGAAAAAAPPVPARLGAGLMEASPQLCDFYQKKFDAILGGAPGSIDVVIRNASNRGCIIKGI